MSAFAQSRNIAILKIWSQCLLFVQGYLENFLCHQAAAMPVLNGTDYQGPAPDLSAWVLVLLEWYRLYKFRST